VKKDPVAAQTTCGTKPVNGLIGKRAMGGAHEARIRPNTQRDWWKKAGASAMCPYHTTGGDGFYAALRLCSMHQTLDLSHSRRDVALVLPSRPLIPPVSVSKWYYLPMERAWKVGGGRFSGNPRGSTISSCSSSWRTGLPSASIRRAVTKMMRLRLIF